MADCFITRKGGGTGGGFGEEFDYTDVWHYYDVNSVDLENLLWKDIVGTADFILDDGRIENNSLVLPANKFGEATTQGEPMTIYFVLQKPVCEETAIVLGLAGRSGTSGRGCLFYNTEKYGWELSTTLAPYLSYPYDSKYHVFTIARKTNASNEESSTYYNGVALYIDGQLVRFMDRGTIGYYAGFVTLNRGYTNDSYKTDRYCEQDSYFRAIAIGGEHNSEQILNNSKYLLNKYILERN